MKVVNVRIKYGGQVMSYECGKLSPALGDWVVVKNGDLNYLGQVVTAQYICPDEDRPENCCEETEAGSADRPAAEAEAASETAGENSSRQEDDELSRDCDPAAAADFSPKEASPNRRLKLCGGRRMLRLASDADLARQAEHELREKEAFEYCLSRVAAQGLEMKLVAVEVLFDGSKTVFYYTAEERVDFRLLVKELVSRFRTRIEMRQIGVRHEARMIGGLGHCGRCFCCSGFLSNFAPVSVKMAKEQNISLSPSKISGVCGRLMCCLAFEHTGPLPKGNSKGGRDLDC